MKTKIATITMAFAFAIILSACGRPMDSGAGNLAPAGDASEIFSSFKPASSKLDEVARPTEEIKSFQFTFRKNFSVGAWSVQYFKAEVDFSNPILKVTGTAQKVTSGGGSVSIGVGDNKECHDQIALSASEVTMIHTRLDQMKYCKPRLAEDLICPMMESLQDPHEAADLKIVRQTKTDYLSSNECLLARDSTIVTLCQSETALEDFFASKISSALAESCAGAE